MNHLNQLQIAQIVTTPQMIRIRLKGSDRWMRSDRGNRPLEAWASRTSRVCADAGVVMADIERVRAAIMDAEASIELLRLTGEEVPA